MSEEEEVVRLKYNILRRALIRDYNGEEMSIEPLYLLSLKLEGRTFEELKEIEKKERIDMIDMIKRKGGRPKKFTDIKKGETKTYDKEVTLVVKKLERNGSREIIRAFVCPEEWKFVYASAKKKECES